MDSLWTAPSPCAKSWNPHAKATRRIAQLKREMQDLGSVNLGAIAEFQRVSERYDYLTGQRADVLSAKARPDRHH